MSDKSFCTFLTCVPQVGIQLLKLSYLVLLNIPWDIPCSLKLLFQKMPSRIYQLHGEVLDTLACLKCHFSIQAVQFFPSFPVQHCNAILISKAIYEPNDEKHIFTEGGKKKL